MLYTERAHFYHRYKVASAIVGIYSAAPRKSVLDINPTPFASAIEGIYYAAPESPFWM